MLNGTLFERAIAWSFASEPELLAEARARFEQRTAPLDPRATDYEARISHFFEHYLCSAADDAPPPLARFAKTLEPLGEQTRAQLRALVLSQRALVEVLEVRGDHGRVADLLREARYHVQLFDADLELRVGDRFDGRLVPLGDRIVLSKGRVYHPRAGHAPMDAVIHEARRQGRREEPMLDALLRMRARFLGFESIRPEHVYRYDAIDEPSFAAPWAKHQKTPDSPPGG